MESFEIKESSTMVHSQQEDQSTPPSLELLAAESDSSVQEVGNVLVEMVDDMSLPDVDMDDMEVLQEVMNDMLDTVEADVASSCESNMKMPPQKPVGNGYYGYEDVSHLPGNAVENSSTPITDTPVEQSTTNPDNDFAEYLWMENEEEFDKQVMQQLEEEELMEQCLEAMLEEEQNNMTDERTNRTSPQNPVTAENRDIMNLVDNFKLELVDVANSTLNPLAAEFVPDARTTPPPRNTE